MRILLISFSELPTLQRHLYVLANELSSLGADVSTIGSSHLTINADLAGANRLIKTPESPKPSLSSLTAAARELNNLISEIRKINPEIIHFINKHTWNYFLIMKIKRQFKDAKIVHTFHDPIGHSGDAVQNGVIFYHKAVQGFLDGIIVHSDIAKRQTENRLKPKCAVFQIPLGEKPWREYASSSDKCREALVFGRLNPYKGVKYYPLILDELNRIDSSIHVTVAGKPSKSVDAYLLSEISRKPNCTLIDDFVNEDDIDSYFARAGVVMIPYTSITQSGVILDAYSRSRSVVAFNIPGIAQYVPEPACLVEPFDCESFASRVALLLNDCETRERLSYSLWQYGKERFSPICMAKSAFDVYSQILDGR